jgi:DNA-directed RNA polymerase specialized sigma subunit
VRVPDTGVTDPAPATAASGRSPATAVPSRAERDRALFTRFRDPDDPVDRDLIVDRFLPLARCLAARCERPEEPFDDIFQVACFGLVKAVDRFDPARGSRSRASPSRR